MGRQRAHRRTRRALDDSAALVRAHCRPIGDWRPVEARPPYRLAASLWPLYGRLCWTCVCGEVVRAVAAEVAEGPGLLLACATCGQVFQQRRDPAHAVRPVMLPTDANVCRRLRIRMAGSSPCVMTRGIGLSFSSDSSRVSAFQRRGEEWDQVQ